MRALEINNARFARTNREIGEKSGERFSAKNLTRHRRSENKKTWTLIKSSTYITRYRFLQYPYIRIDRYYALIINSLSPARVIAPQSLWVVKNFCRPMMFTRSICVELLKYLRRSSRNYRFGEKKKDRLLFHTQRKYVSIRSASSKKIYSSPR